MVGEISSDRGGHAHRFKQPEKGAHCMGPGLNSRGFNLGSATE